MAQNSSGPSQLITTSPYLEYRRATSVVCQLRIRFKSQQKTMSEVLNANPTIRAASDLPTRRGRTPSSTSAKRPSGFFSTIIPSPTYLNDPFDEPSTTESNSDDEVEPIDEQEIYGMQISPRSSPQINSLLSFTNSILANCSLQLQTSSPRSPTPNTLCPLGPSPLLIFPTSTSPLSARTSAPSPSSLRPQ